jgi:hypothetical protein
MVLMISLNNVIDQNIGEFFGGFFFGYDKFFEDD